MAGIGSMKGGPRRTRSAQATPGSGRPRTRRGARQEANAFARELRERLPGRPLVVTPAPFLAPGWSQAEYLALWESLIRTRFRAVYFSRDWEYSTGCTFELAVARDAGLPTYDAAGRALDLDGAIGLISRSARDLEAEGFDVSGLRLNLKRLEAIREEQGAAPEGRPRSTKTGFYEVGGHQTQTST